jgi:hypothetical protein
VKAGCIHRYRIPAGAGPRVIPLTGDPVHVEAAGDGAVDFWAHHSPRDTPRDRTFQVVGTGQPVPAGARYIGTTGRTPAGHTWHLLEIVVTAITSPGTGSEPAPLATGQYLD